MYHQVFQQYLTTSMNIKRESTNCVSAWIAGIVSLNDVSSIVSAFSSHLTNHLASWYAHLFLVSSLLCFSMLGKVYWAHFGCFCRMRKVVIGSNQNVHCCIYTLICLKRNKMRSYLLWYFPCQPMKTLEGRRLYKVSNNDRWSGYNCLIDGGHKEWVQMSLPYST